MIGKKPLYNRVLLKLSGEALLGNSQFGISPSVIDRIAKELKQLLNLGVQVAVVIGGGNLFRGKELSKAGLGRISGDHMGMVATIMNALALRDAFDRADISTRVLSAIPMTGIVDPYHHRKAIHHLNQGRVVIFSAGTGNPFVTTDSAASLRAIEINADVLLKATNVDGIYDSDPIVNENATLYKSLTFSEVLRKELAVMDLAAFCQCRDYNIPVRVFNINKINVLVNVVQTKTEGTSVSNEE